MNRRAHARRRGQARIVAVLILTLWPSCMLCQGAGLTLEADGVAFEFVPIPAGRFLMGSVSGDSDERPVHEVTIARAFHMMCAEVTVRQFKAFVEDTGYRTDAERSNWAWLCPVGGLAGPDRNLNWRIPGFKSSDDDPVVVLSWNDAMAFCRWLSEKTGRTLRLPTEAEWEYAARAGRAAAPTSDVGIAGWYEDNADGQAHPAGRKVPNAWGLHDMQGNAWEWCLDVWHPTYDGAPVDGTARRRDPGIPPVAWRYVLRGGCWASPAEHLRYAYRYRGTHNFRNCGTGFRVVLAPSAGMGDASPAPVVESSLVPRVTLDDLGFDLVRINAGEFLMGSNEDDEQKPIHTVAIGYDFEIGRTEVTRKQFRAFVETTGYITEAEKEGWGWTRSRWKDWHPELDICWLDPGYAQEDDHPAACISWYDAMAFCRWLAQASGQKIRLPSGAEWEYACRAGTTGDYAGDVEEMGWHRYNSGQRSHPVGQRKPNAWGLHDMHGNVWEWCTDMWHFGYEGAPTDGTAWTTADIFIPLMRGGSFTNPPWWLRSAMNMRNDPGCRHSYNQGFRIVRDLPAARGARVVRQDPPRAGVKMAPVRTEFPAPMYVGTQENIRAPRIKPVQKLPGPPFLAPAGTRNVARGKRVSSSDGAPITGALEMITDGDKEAADGSYVELGPFPQHVTLDLETAHAIYGLRVWHFHQTPRVYFDVVVQVSPDPDFVADVRTVFNNDMDNSAGLGIGEDMHYVETHFGELFDAQGVRGRYVRLHSNGNTGNDQNHYIEVEVYGKLIKEAGNLAAQMNVTPGSEVGERRI